MNEPTYGLIGRGRVATHMARYLELEKLPFATWHRGMPSPPEAALTSADTILLAVNDRAILPFIEHHPRLRDRPIVHFSGSMVVDGAHGLHPLMTFGPDLYDIETVRRHRRALENDPYARVYRAFAEIFDLEEATA